jgi:SAM-dependent methyltransferase
MSPLPETGFDPAVTWHDVECGSYAADLPLWTRLSREAEGPILDLGCGTGRVALHLGRRGHAVTGVDSAPPLVAELGRRAARESLRSVSARRGDACGLDLGHSFALALAPMQLLQVLGGADRRLACLRGIAAHLAPGGRAALAILASLEEGEAEGGQPLPDVLEVDGWICSSQPLALRRGGDQILVTRLRQLVSPAGELSEERSEVRLHELTLNTLEAEAAQAGLRLAEALAVPASEDHVGSTVAIMEAA